MCKKQDNNFIWLEDESLDNVGWGDRVRTIKKKDKELVGIDARCMTANLRTTLFKESEGRTSRGLWQD
jgi:hypothetical protein